MFDERVLPQYRSFLLGLGSFAIAHIFFIRAFLYHGYELTVSKTLLALAELALGVFALVQ